MSFLLFLLLLALLEQASRAAVFTLVLLVLPGVEEPTDLMDPSLAGIALYPALFVDFVILLLQKLSLLHADISDLDRDAPVKLVETRSTPKVLVPTANVVVAVPAYALAGAIHTVAEIYGRLEQNLFAATQATRAIVLLAFLLFPLDTCHGLFVLLNEHCLEFFGHAVDHRSLLVVKDRIVEGKVDVGAKFADGVILTIVSAVDFLLNGAKIHRLLDDVEVIRQTQLDGINGDIEYPSMLVIHYYLEQLLALGLDL